MKILTLAKALIALTLLSSCTMMSKEDCQEANWKSIGFKAARKGESKSHYAKVSQQCSKHGVTAKKRNYNKGRVAGLQEFCTYKSGRLLGYNDNIYEGVCPAKLEQDFLRGYNLGKNEFFREEQERALKEQRERQEAELERMREQQEEELDRIRTNSQGFNSINCAHITADGGCAHEL